MKQILENSYENASKNHSFTLFLTETLVPPHQKYIRFFLPPLFFSFPHLFEEIVLGQNSPVQRGVGGHYGGVLNVVIKRIFLFFIFVFNFHLKHKPLK